MEFCIYSMKKEDFHTWKESFRWEFNHHFSVRVKKFSALMNPSELACMTLELKSHDLYTIFISLQRIKQKTKKSFYWERKRSGVVFMELIAQLGIPIVMMGWLETQPKLSKLTCEFQPNIATPEREQRLNLTACCCSQTHSHQITWGTVPVRGALESFAGAVPSHSPCLVHRYLWKLLRW